eukprot:274254_1
MFPNFNKLNGESREFYTKLVSLSFGNNDEKMFDFFHSVIHNKEKALLVAEIAQDCYTTDHSQSPTKIHNAFFTTDTDEMISILKKGIKLHIKVPRVAKKLQIAVTYANQFKLKQQDYHFQQTIKRLRFSFKPLFSTVPYAVHSNPHAQYRISYIPRKDGHTPKSLEIRVSLLPRPFAGMKVAEYLTHKQSMRTMNISSFLCYLSNISQDMSMNMQREFSASETLKVKNTICALKRNLHQIDNKWSDRFRYGYAILFIRKNYECIVVNVLFNDKKLFNDTYTNLFEIKFRHRNKCECCKLKRSDKVKLKQCSKCFHAMYCSRRCQKYDWKKRHRYHCHAILGWKSTTL